LNERNYYNLIHGDTHLGNILIDENQQIYFIDPRGYFGETKLFGLYEYDYAKLMFGISGYSIFDTMEIAELDIKDGNINIEFIKKYEYVFTNMFDEITTLFCLSIWLGNNSCFTSINKKITSLMIAYYYCEKYLIPNQSNTSFLVSHN
jgi:predicted unusual protein kinase regulating ubiquinone biosynthesis (AarF/ABC1/UbiB family)